MQRDLRPGSRVARRDIPGIVGVLVSFRGASALVRWSEHFSQLVLKKQLILVRKQETLRGKEVSHD
jgi:hypothetical protein